MKYGDLVQQLRSEIHQGIWAPGERLPARLELLQTYRTNPLTLQRAIAELLQGGYLRTAGRAGTFIVDHPPHLSHYALVFPNAPDLANSQFYLALRNEAAKLQQPGRYISTFYHINGHVDVDDYRRLLHGIQHHHFAGVIFAASTFILDGSPVLEESGMPRVVVSSPDQRVNIPKIAFKFDELLPRALDRLAARGCTRVAVITIASGTIPPW